MMCAVYKRLQLTMWLEITSRVGTRGASLFLIERRRDWRRLETLIDPARVGASVEHREGAACFERRQREAKAGLLLFPHFRALPSLRALLANIL
jgi:hypothetical protein